MRELAFLVAVLTFGTTLQVSGFEIEIKCGRYEPCHEATSCCIMDVASVINSTEVTISERDDEIDGIDFSENKNILYLPVLVHEKLPNLIAYYAYHCSVREISKRNFEKLGRLEDLNLNSNQIETIGSDTFEDLVALQQLHISSNLITRMNGMVIHKLVALELIDLRKNQCIDRWFSAGGNRLIFNGNAARVINENCHFDESDSEELTREVENVGLINEYFNSKQLKQGKLTSGAGTRNFKRIVLILAILVIFSYQNNS